MDEKRALREGQTLDAERQGQADAVLAELADVQAAENLSDATLARIIGVSRTVVSLVKRRRYTGDAQAVLKTLRDWLSRRADRMEVPQAAYAPTSIGERILTVCDLAVQQPCVGVVKTPSGAGKTAALREMARRLGANRCLYVQAGEAVSTKRQLLLEIAVALRIEAPPEASAHDLYRRVRNRLGGFFAGGRGEPFLLAIDEATTLRPEAVNLVRNLHDDPTCRAAVVLADTVTRLDGFLYGRRGIAGGNEQLRSRARAQFVMADPAADKGGEISEEDVRLVADVTLHSLGHKAGLSAPAYRYLTRLAQRPGTLRNVTGRLSNVGYYAGRRSARATFCVAEMDYVATLSGETWQMPHEADPFAGRPQNVPPLTPCVKGPASARAAAG